MKRVIFFLALLFGVTAALSVFCSAAGPGTVPDNCYAVTDDAQADFIPFTLYSKYMLHEEMCSVEVHLTVYHVPSVDNPKEWKPIVRAVRYVARSSC